MSQVLFFSTLQYILYLRHMRYSVVPSVWQAPKKNLFKTTFSLCFKYDRYSSTIEVLQVSKKSY